MELIIFGVPAMFFLTFGFVILLKEFIEFAKHRMDSGMIATGVPLFAIGWIILFLGLSIFFYVIEVCLNLLNSIIN